MKFRPQFIEPDNMKFLGFNLVSDKDGYLEYVNDGTKHYNKDYNKEFPEPKGKVCLQVNTTYSNDYFYLGISQDGKTRTSYAGVCDNEVFLKLLLNNVR